jgi:hypothetical protein
MKDIHIATMLLQSVSRLVLGAYMVIWFVVHVYEVDSSSKHCGTCLTLSQCISNEK